MSRRAPGWGRSTSTPAWCGCRPRPRPRPPKAEIPATPAKPPCLRRCRLGGVAGEGEMPDAVDVPGSAVVDSAGGVEVGEPGEQCLQGRARFQAGQSGAKAIMNPGREGQV